MLSLRLPLALSLAVATLALLPAAAFSQPTMVESFFVKVEGDKKYQDPLKSCAESFRNELVNTRAFKEMISREIELALSSCVADESNPSYAQSCDLTSVSRTVDLVIQFSVTKSGKELRFKAAAISPMEGYATIWGDAVKGPSGEAYDLCGDLGQRFLTIVDLSVLSSYDDGRSCEGKVLVDGEKQGNTPLKLKVLAASHTVEVQCDEGGSSVEVDLTAGEKKSLSVEISLGPKVSDGYVEVKAGSFQMGSPTSEPDRETDETQHQVTLTRDFFLKTTEVTQGEWRAVMGNNPSYFSSCGDDCPVESVSWYDSLAYLNALSKSEGVEACYELSGCSGTAGGGCSRAYACTGNYSCTVKFKGLDCKGYRLPTEAEWEVAARAGSTGKYSDGSSSPDAVAWHSGNSDSKTHTVSQKSANAWGLYDMHGNVWEWTWDWSGDYPAKATDPQGADSGTYRVFRGGSWYVGAANARSASRGRSGPAGRYGSLGFRPARSLP